MQFSLLICNVTLDIQDNEILNDLQNDFPDIINLRRSTDKNNPPTTMAPLEVKSIKTMGDLLKRKHVIINSTRQAVSEYFAPAKVLVYSKCFEFEHFRSTCKYEKDKCRIWGLEVDDIKKHREEGCDKQPHCIRCNNNHDLSA
ncbi:unnamed protein product [Didymodactylos carnosus]|uniref:Uncharacterized protein n=1 Tax=Didymodactylos carnosus TaxID=1234261 RepID=A0A814RL57_9BILA|nr:unnamed protein product [Didymodactylos carnosus]CAF3898828.1 unnamed protein product [Didymodactylos carnosus]